MLNALKHKLKLNAVHIPDIYIFLFLVSRLYVKGIDRRSEPRDLLFQRQKEFLRRMRRQWINSQEEVSEISGRASELLKRIKEFSRLAWKMFTKIFLLISQGVTKSSAVCSYFPFFAVYYLLPVRFFYFFISLPHTHYPTPHKDGVQDMAEFPQDEESRRGILQTLSAAAVERNQRDQVRVFFNTESRSLLVIPTGNKNVIYIRSQFLEPRKKSWRRDYQNLT